MRIMAFLNLDEAKTRTTVSAPVSDVLEKARHQASVYASITGVSIGALAFIKSDCQERNYE